MILTSDRMHRVLESPRATATSAGPKPRIVIAVQLPFTEIDYPKFELERLLEHGFEIDIIDMSAVIYPAETFPRRTSPLPAGVAEIVITEGRELSKLGDVFDRARLIVCSVSSGHLNKSVLAPMRAISASRTPYMLIYRNPVPQIDRPIIRPTLGQRLRRLNVMNSIMNRLPLSALGVRVADFIILGGQASSIPMRLVGRSTRKAWSYAEARRNYLDEIEVRPSAPTKKCAVYIDQYFAFHPDMAMVDRSQYVDPERIYPVLRAMFTRIEQELGLPVVIAAHPRADYSAMPEIFGDRDIVTGKTAELIRQCDLVVCFYSTAANFAVMFDKPMFIMKLPELQKIRSVSNAPDALAQVIGKTAVDISDPMSVDLPDVLHVNKEKYRWFIERYIESDLSLVWASPIPLPIYVQRWTRTHRQRPNIHPKKKNDTNVRHFSMDQ